MATVTGMTAAAMIAIRDQTIVDAEFNAGGHLILTTYGGQQIDAGVIGSATTGQAGIVELATTEETTSLVDATRAVTPAGLAETVNGLDARIDILEATRVQILTGVEESALPDSYPPGLSLMSLSSGSGWSLNGGSGSVVTNKATTDRTEQTFYSDAGGSTTPQTWWRFYNSSSSGWTTWIQISTLAALDPASFTQGSGVTNYPLGESRIYYDTGNSSAWDFSGNSGEVRTWRDDTYTKQTWTEDEGIQVWIRTAGSDGVWSFWCKTAFQYQLPAIESGRVNIDAVANTVTTSTFGFSLGRFDAAPNVTVTAVSSGPYTLVRSVTTQNITNSQFDISIYRTNSGTTGVDYIAALAP